jgi:hypothetical protein
MLSDSRIIYGVEMWGGSDARKALDKIHGRFIRKC